MNTFKNKHFQFESFILFHLSKILSIPKRHTGISLKQLLGMDHYFKIWGGGLGGGCVVFSSKNFFRVRFFFDWFHMCLRWLARTIFFCRFILGRYSFFFSVIAQPPNPPPPHQKYSGPCLTDTSVILTSHGCHGSYILRWFKMNKKRRVILRERSWLQEVKYGTRTKDTCTMIFSPRNVFISRYWILLL